MKYDFNFFHDQLLLLQNQDYNQYKDVPLFDILINHLDEEYIYDYYEVDWSLFANNFVDYKVKRDKGMPYDYNQVVKSNKLETICHRFFNRGVRIKLLLFLQRNIKTLWPNWDNTEFIEQECARLISENIQQSKYDEFHGDFANLPRPNLRKMLVNPNIFKEKSEDGKFIEAYIYRKNHKEMIPCTLPEALNELQELKKQVSKLTEENQKLRAQLEKPLQQNKAKRTGKYKDPDFFKKVQAAPNFNETYFRSDLIETQISYIDKELKVACSKRNAGVAVAEVLCNSTNKATYLAIANVPNTDLYYSLVKTYGLTVAPSTFYDAMRKAQKP